MSDNSNLQAARNIKFDEFYTTSEDIEKELSHYTFIGKKVYCNCDNPEYSNFWKYFHSNYSQLGLRGLASSYFTGEGNEHLTLYNGSVISKSILPNGDFRSIHCRRVLEQADVIVTNPPFSLIREFIKLLFNYNKEFLIIGPLNFIKYKDVFPYIKEGKLRMGINGGSMKFIVPREYKKEGFTKLNNIYWYTNMRVGDPPFLNLCNTYRGDESKYPKYDNYDAIEVSKVKDIPIDYEGIMGVPITFLHKYNPNQFEIVGEFNHGCDNKYDLAAPKINGKLLYPRIAIKWK